MTHIAPRRGCPDDGRTKGAKTAKPYRAIDKPRADNREAKGMPIKQLRGTADGLVKRIRETSRASVRRAKGGETRAERISGEQADRKKTRDSDRNYETDKQTVGQSKKTRLTERHVGRQSPGKH